MFIVSKVLLPSSVTVIIRTGGAIWSNPFATVLFNVGSAVTVECCVFTRVAWVCFLLYKVEALLQCLCNYWEEGYGPVWGAIVYVFLDFGMGIMLSNFHMWGIMLVLRAVFNMLVSNASLGGPMCFRCLMFSLLGHCALLFLIFFIASWTWVVVSVMLYPCILCVAPLMNLFACLAGFVNCLVKQFAISLAVVVILLLNVMEVFSMGGGDLIVYGLPKNVRVVPVTPVCIYVFLQ